MSEPVKASPTTTSDGLPAGLSVHADGGKYPFAGWTTRLLPDIEQSELWAQIEQAFATDPNPLSFYGDVAHRRLMGKIVLLFNCPSDPRLPGPSVKTVWYRSPCTWGSRAAT